MTRLTFYPLFESYFAVLLLAGALVAMLFVFGVAREKVAGRKRRGLLLLRGAVILLTAFAMLRPTLVYTQTRKLAATLVLLVDASRSMTVSDEINGRSRWQAATENLDRAHASIDRLQKDFEVKAYTFSNEFQSVPLKDGHLEYPTGSPDGSATAIGHAIDRVVDDEAGKRLLAVFLLSDGAQRARAPFDTAPQDAAARLRDAGAPLYTLAVGNSRMLGQTQDVAITDLLAPSHMFVNNELTVSGQIRIDGYVGRDIPVRLLYETSPGQMTQVDGATVRATASGQLVPFTFHYIPTEPGEHKLEVEIPPQPRELVETNNRASTFVQVLKGGLRVLVIEGDWRIEQKFLRRALDASPDIDVDYVRLDASHPETRPADFDQYLAPGRYAVYILGNVDATAFTKEQLQRLADNVSNGAGLLMIGGRQSFGPGGYSDTPLAGPLPIEMHSYERQNLGDPIREDLHIAGPVRMRPTANGERHFALRIAPSRDALKKLWDELPPLDGVNRFSAVKRSGLVLAETENGAPVLVSQSYGGGRVLAFAGDTTWRWWMQGHEDVHKRFWRQVLLWLAKKDESLEGNVWIQLDRRSFGVGDPVMFFVGGQTPSGEPVIDATGEAIVTGPDGAERTVSLTRKDGQLQGEFLQTEKQGDYIIQATLESGGQALGTARSRFTVSTQDLELDNAAADPQLMESLAQMTGGRLLAPEEIPAVLEQILQSTQDLEEQSETKQSLWDTWWFLIVFVALLAAEWYLRKRWGLV